MIRDCDMITVGASGAAEAKEDIELSFDALERSHAAIPGRASPFRQAVLGHKE